MVPVDAQPHGFRGCPLLNRPGIGELTMLVGFGLAWRQVVDRPEEALMVEPDHPASSSVFQGACRWISSAFYGMHLPLSL